MARRISTMLGAAALTTLLTAGCSSLGLDDVETGPARTGEENPITGRPLRVGEEAPGSALGGGPGSLFGFGGDENAGAQLPVNRYLWRATLDTLSFLPLASTDPYGGVIITEWGASPNAPEERFKVTAYITSAELSANSLRVAVARQTLEGAAWVDAPVAEDTARSLENAILTRARVLRSGELEE